MGFLSRNPKSSLIEMIFLRIILGALFLRAVFGIVFAVLLASNYREQTLLFLNALRANVLKCLSKFKLIPRFRKPADPSNRPFAQGPV